MIVKEVSICDSKLLELINELDQGLAITDGEEHGFYNQFNRLEELSKVFIGYVDDQAIACGGYKMIDEETAELKRMYVKDFYRGKKYGEKLLKHIEKEIIQSGVDQLILETGTKQVAAVKLYTRNGFRRISNYGPYIGKELSLCYTKSLKGDL